MEAWHKEAVRKLLKSLAQQADEVDSGYQRGITISETEARMLKAAFEKLMPDEELEEPEE